MDNEIIRITIDLGGEKNPENIIVYKGQENDSVQLARNFCLKHGFDEKIMDVLAQ